VSGRLSKAERDGRFAEKLDTCAKGIEEIKTKLGVQENAQNMHNVKLSAFEQRVRNLEDRVKDLEVAKNHVN
jgi:flagellin-like hook-associated protein FlgL